MISCKSALTGVSVSDAYITSISTSRLVVFGTCLAVETATSDWLENNQGQNLKYHKTLK